MKKTTFNSYLILFSRIWESTILISFKIVDCIIIHWKPDVEIEQFLHGYAFWASKAKATSQQFRLKLVEMMWILYFSPIVQVFTH